MTRPAAGRTDWVLRTLRDHEPAALHGQSPIVWDRACGDRVWNAEGRCWLDWTSGILTANAGHSPPEVVEAICAQARQGLLHAYTFPTEVRARLLRALVELTGFPQVVLLTTGSEAVEACLKIARSHAIARGRHRAVVITFDGAFHGRTMGAQLAGGIAEQRHWTGTGAEMFVRVPFPARGESWSPAALAEALEEALAEAGAGPRDVAVVLSEIFQGSTLRVLDHDAAMGLRDWCTEHGVLLAFDEIQSGFGRTGRLFGHHHSGVRPDLLLCGKGLSGSLPVSAVLIADPAVTTQLRSGELGTTHGANPVALAAAEANLGLFRDGSLVAAAAERGRALATGLATWADSDPERRLVRSFGMVAGLRLVGDGGTGDADAARRLVGACSEHGLLLCAPVGADGSLVKIMPPLTTSPERLREGLARLGAATEAAERRAGRQVPASGVYGNDLPDADPRRG